MAADWPEYAKQTGQSSLAYTTNTRSTGFEDGEQRQERISTRSALRRRLVVDIPAERVTEWLNWLAGCAHLRISWRDPHDGVRRYVRISDGAGGVNTRQVSTRGSVPRWLAELTIYGYLDDIV